MTSIIRNTNILKPKENTSYLTITTTAKIITMNLIIIIAIIIIVKIKTSKN